MVSLEFGPPVRHRSSHATIPAGTRQKSFCRFNFWQPKAPSTQYQTNRPSFLPSSLCPNLQDIGDLFLDFSSLNSFMKTPKFWMTDHASLADLLSPPAWMASLDLQDTYLLIPIRPNLHKFLAYRTESLLWFFKFCPWSFASPSTILQSFQVPPSVLRTRGMQVLSYLDDWVFWAATKESLNHNLTEACSFLQDLGWLIISHSQT